MDQKDIHEPQKTPADESQSKATDGQSSPPSAEITPLTPASAIRVCRSNLRAARAILSHRHLSPEASKIPLLQGWKNIAVAVAGQPLDDSGPDLIESIAMAFAKYNGVVPTLDTILSDINWLQEDSGESLVESHGVTPVSRYDAALSNLDAVCHQVSGRHAKGIGPISKKAIDTTKTGLLGLAVLTIVRKLSGTNKTKFNTVFGFDYKWWRRTLGILFNASLITMLAAAGCECKPASSPDADALGVVGPDPRKPSYCTTADEHPPSPSKRVVLVVIDTLRADGLGLYGYDKPTSPTLDKIASESIVFDNFFAASPWTAPSFGTILTGEPPTVHKIGWRLFKTESMLQDNSSATMKVGGVHITNLRSNIKTLPEFLPDMPTGAIVNNAFLHPDVGLTKYFKHYDLVIPYGKKKSLSHPKRLRDAEETTQSSIAWLASHKNDDFFLMVHYFDPHVAYNPPKQYREIFTPTPTKRFATKFADPTNARNGKLKLTDAEKVQVRGLYDGEVRFVDDQLGLLLQAMNQMEMLKNTWLVVTADHGEEHFDHGGFDHGHRYENEVMRIPLIIRPPNGKWCAGTRVSASASHVDLMPTIMDWYGIEPAADTEGKSLLPLVTGEEKTHRMAYMEYNLYWGQQCAITDGRFKMIKNLKSGKRFMYDLALDPGEKIKLGEDHPHFAKLSHQLDAYRERLEKRAAKLDAVAPAGAPEAVQLDSEVSESLRALGYIE